MKCEGVVLSELSANIKARIGNIYFSNSSEGRDSRSRLGFETKDTETFGLVSVSLQFWILISLGLGLVYLFIFLGLSGLVSSQNIGNLENLLRSRQVLVSVLRLKVWDSQSRPGLVPPFIIKNSRSQTRPFVNCTRSLVLGLVAKYWSRHSV
jgi:hypothetical protein